MTARGAGTPPRDQREEEGQDGKHRIDLEESLRDRLGKHSCTLAFSLLRAGVLQFVAHTPQRGVMKELQRVYSPPSQMEVHVHFFLPNDPCLPPSSRRHL